MSPCPRRFEVQARRDGRLSAAEAAHFERHLLACPSCTQELAALENLQRELRQATALESDELHIRRQRTRLLAAFDQGLVEPATSPRRYWRAAAGALLAAAALLLVLAWRKWPIALRPPASNVAIRADESSAWSQRQVGGREQIRLQRGTLWIQVSHGLQELALLLELPDGELEDTGTTFSVTVEGGHTRRVAVEAGSVILRLRGAPAVTLRAHESWAPSDLRESASANTPSIATSVTSAIPAPTQLPSPGSPSSAPLVGAAANPPVLTTARASDDFREAVATLNAGNGRAAASQFARFIAAHPHDARAEDAAYLRVLALRQAGDQAAMQAAGRAYLEQYRAGFRRSEVERLVHTP